jgi:PAS domain S-box-containing protein
MVMLWGHEGVMIYNDAYSVFAGGRHPWLLGTNVREGWPEVADFNDNVMKVGLAGGTLAYRDQQLTLLRHGRPEQVFMNLDYSPVPDETGRPAGVLAIVVETTGQVATQTALRDSQARYKSLLETTETGFCIVQMKFDEQNRAVDYRIVESNAAFEDLTGLKDATGKWVSEIAPGLERHWFDVYGQVALTGEAVRFENQAASFGRWYDVQALRVGQPEERRVAILFNNITERVKREERQATMLALDDALSASADAEAVLVAATELLGRTLGASRVGFGEIDADRQTIDVLTDWRAKDGQASVVGGHAFADYGDYVEDLLLGRPVLIEDVRTDPRTKADPLPLLSYDIAALMDVPLTDQGRTVAQLFIHSDAPRVWTPEEAAFVRDFGERTRAAFARREAEVVARHRQTELQRLTDSLPVLVSFVDREHRYALNNQAYRDWFGDTAKTMVGRHMRDVLGLEAYEKARPRIEAALAGERLSYEDYLPYREGGGRHVRADYVPRRDEDGEVDGFYAIVQDISERKQAELRQRVLVEVTDAIRDENDPGALAAAAAQVLGRFLEVDRVGYATIDATAETLTIERDWTSSRASSIAGTLNLREWGDFIDDLKAGRLIRVTDVRGDPRIAHASQDLEAAACRAFVNVPLLENGELVAMLYVNHAHARAWTDEEVALSVEVAGRIRTATERAATAHALRVSEARLRFLSELDEALRSAADAPAAMKIGAALLGERLGVSRCAYADVDMDADNDRFFIRDDYCAPGITSSAGTYSLDLFGSRAATDMRGGQTLVIRDMAGELTMGDGREMFLSIGIAAIVCCPLVRNGRLAAMMAVHQDQPRDWHADEIALIQAVVERCWAHVERVGAEARLIALNATLEDRVAERTAELMRTEEALRQSQKMEAVGQLTGGIAHDFNNLLAGISGSLELIEKRMGEGRLAGMDRYIQAAQGASRRAATLTQRLLAFSRRQTLDPKPTDVNRLVLGMEDLIRRSVGPDVTVSIDAACDLWVTCIDASQLENALLNLCINSRDAMAPDGGDLTIRTWNVTMNAAEARSRDLQPGDYVKMSVTDTGSGMTPEVAIKAFDPFFTTKPLGQGTGLGLSMIHGFMRQSGGQVRIESAPGQGTTITLALPRWLGSAEAGEAPDVEAVAEETGQGETVLVIDDEETVRMLVVEVLEDAGYSVLQAADGPAGLAILNTDARIDLLVSDVGLPGGMNGRQVADAARVMRPGLKVLFITGYAENAVVAGDSLEAGMAVMTKPFQVSALGARIREMIEG